jgi:hypothetical protein
VNTQYLYFESYSINMKFLPLKVQEWEKSAWALANEMDEYAENYKCKKCSGNYCEHMLHARGRKFGKRVNTQISSFF